MLNSAFAVTAVTLFHSSKANFSQVNFPLVAESTIMASKQFLYQILRIAITDQHVLMSCEERGTYNWGVYIFLDRVPIHHKAQSHTLRLYRQIRDPNQPTVWGRKPETRSSQRKPLKHWWEHANSTHTGSAEAGIKLL